MSFTHNFSANTGYLWKELSFIDRLAIAKKYGFESLEFHDEPHYENLTELQSILSKLELPVNGMNVRMGETFGCAALSEYNEKYLNDINDAVQAMMVVLADGGFKTGGLNFDAKVRRESTTVEDLVVAHIGGMDTFARALIIADNILNNSSIPRNKIKRYASFDSGMGKAFENGELTLQDLRDHAAKSGEPAQISGNQELLENIINDHMFRI